MGSTRDLGARQYLINHRKFQVQNQQLAKEEILKEVYDPSLYANLHLQIIMNQWKIQKQKKTPKLMCLRKLKKLPMII